MKWVILVSCVAWLASAQTTVSITATNANQVEGNSGTTAFTFTVARTGDTTGVSSVNYAVVPQTAAPSDFSGSVTGVVNFAATETSQLITISVVGDTVPEATETFSVTLSNPVGATLGTASATGSIQNDDTSLTITSVNGALPEGNSGTTAYAFTVTRAGVTSGVSSAEYTLTGTNGLDAADFGGVLPSGSVNFGGGETQQTITINVSGDSVFEADETFTVTLSNPNGAALGGQSTATSTITNDDTEIGITATDANKLEGNSGTTVFTFTLSRNGVVSGVSTVQYAVAATGTLNGEDFVGGVLPSGTINFAAGQSSQILHINVAGDTANEANEGFTVTLSNPTNAVLSGTAASAVGTIQNDPSDTGATQITPATTTANNNNPPSGTASEDDDNSALIGGLVGGIGGGLCLLLICCTIIAAILLMKRKGNRRREMVGWEPAMDAPRSGYQAPAPTPVMYEYATPVEYAPVYNSIPMVVV